MSISKKLETIHTDGWRGYQQPIQAVCGANDTGMWDDSPCPTTVCKAELKLATAILRKAKIQYRLMTCQSSNVFCVHRYVVTSKKDMQLAIELIKPLISETKLLYITNDD